MLLEGQLAFLNHFPLFAVMLRLKDSKRLPGGLTFELVNDETLVMKVKKSLVWMLDTLTMSPTEQAPSVERHLFPAHPTESSTRFALFAALLARTPLDWSHDFAHREGQVATMGQGRRCGRSNSNRNHNNNRH